MTEETANSKNIFPDDFLGELATKFSLPPFGPEQASALRLIARRYQMDQNISAQPDPKHRAIYVRLKKSTEKYIALLGEDDFVELPSDMYFAAMSSGEKPPQTEFPELSEHQKIRGEPYFLELIRLLNLVKLTASENIEQLKLPRGRQANFALSNFVRRAADIWEQKFGRKFTVDYHQGSGTTEAFGFVKTLLARIDPEISDTSIITAMRTEIEKRRALLAIKSEE